MIESENSVFRLHPELYDALVDWPKRLANERPLLETLFAAVAARRVLDAACGTGHHALMFRSMGLTVEGADANEAMISHCRGRHADSDTLRWTLRSYTDPPTGQFDAVICIGNSLALCGDLATAERAVAALLGALRPGGLLFAQVLNIWRLEEGPTTWQKCRRVRANDQELLLIKGVHRSGGEAYIDLVGVTQDGGEHTLHPGGARLLGFECDWFERVFDAHDGREWVFYGDYQATPFDRNASADLIAVAYRA